MQLFFDFMIEFEHKNPWSANFINFYGHFLFQIEETVLTNRGMLYIMNLS